MRLGYPVFIYDLVLEHEILVIIGAHFVARVVGYRVLEFLAVLSVARYAFGIVIVIRLLAYVVRFIYGYDLAVLIVNGLYLGRAARFVVIVGVPLILYRLRTVALRDGRIQHLNVVFVLIVLDLMIQLLADVHINAAERVIRIQAELVQIVMIVIGIFLVLDREVSRLLAHCEVFGERLFVDAHLSAPVPERRVFEKIVHGQARAEIAVVE